MACIIVHLAIEITDKGAINIHRGSFDLKRNPENVGPITQEEICAIGKAFETVSELPLDKPAGGATRGLMLEGHGPTQSSGVECLTLARKIADKGWLSLENAESLVKFAGISRVREVSNWIARKLATGETVTNPGALLTRVASLKQQPA